MSHILFSTEVHQRKLKITPKVHAEILRTSLKLREIDHAGAQWCKKNYLNGYTSYGSMSDLHKQFSVFETLKIALDKEAVFYSKKLFKV